MVTLNCAEINLELHLFLVEGKLTHDGVKLSTTFLQPLRFLSCRNFSSPERSARFGSADAEFRQPFDPMPDGSIVEDK